MGLQTGPEKNPLHILFSDDDTDDALLFTQAADLMTTPIFLSFAEDGEQLLRFLEKPELPDMVFLDLNMPVRNGIECLEAIRKKPELDKLPIVVYTTSNSPDDIDACFERGANLYVIKPSSFEQIIKVLKRIIQMDIPSRKLPSRENFLLETA